MKQQSRMAHLDRLIMPPGKQDIDSSAKNAKEVSIDWAYISGIEGSQRVQVGEEHRLHPECMVLMSFDDLAPAMRICQPLVEWQSGCRIS